MSVGSNITPKMQPGAIKKHNIFLHRFCLSKWLQNGTPHSGFFDVFGGLGPKVSQEGPKGPPRHTPRSKSYPQKLVFGLVRWSLHDGSYG